jgi:hypothetical protein
MVVERKISFAKRYHRIGKNQALIGVMSKKTPEISWISGAVGEFGFILYLFPPGSDIWR